MVNAEKFVGRGKYERCACCGRKGVYVKKGQEVFKCGGCGSVFEKEEDAEKCCRDEHIVS